MAESLMNCGVHQTCFRRITPACGKCSRNHADASRRTLENDLYDPEEAVRADGQVTCDSCSAINTLENENCRNCGMILPVQVWAKLPRVPVPPLGGHIEAVAD